MVLRVKKEHPISYFAFQFPSRDLGPFGLGLGAIAIICMAARVCGHNKLSNEIVRSVSPPFPHSRCWGPNPFRG